jgi:putative transposase
MNSRPGQSSLRRGRVSITGQIYFITTVTRAREPLFANFDAACAASRAVDDLHPLAWVLMPDHAHWLLQLEEAGKLDTAVMRLKAASARAANRALYRQGPLWQRGYHDRALRSDEDVLAAARYLVANPLRAGLVRKLGSYPFWNAAWL